MQQLFKRMLSVLLAAAVLLSLTVTAFAADGGADTFFPDLSADPQWRLDRRSEDMTENGLTFRYEEYVPLA